MCSSTNRLCSETISGLRGSTNILGKDKMAPDGRPTTKQKYPQRRSQDKCTAINCNILLGGLLGEHDIYISVPDLILNVSSMWFDGTDPGGGDWWCPSLWVWPPGWWWERGRCRTAEGPGVGEGGPVSWTQCCCTAPFPQRVPAQRTHSSGT